MKLGYLLLLVVSLDCVAQKENEVKYLRFTSAYTLFPDSARFTGHTYDKKLYPANIHYSDSSVLIAIPPKFKAGKKTDLVFWFHGWRNNIDSANRYFELTQQFVASNRNAVLVFAEGAKNAPDSYGGKLEKEGVFTNLVNDAMNQLRSNNIITKKAKPGNIMLAGHSGAFRVMAHILQKGGTEIKQVVLFDGLYSQVDKYIAWIQADPAHCFINLYTNKGGGTDEVSIQMMQQLREKNIPYINLEEKEVTPALLKTNPVIFIHSLKEHNDVMNRPDHNFRLFLENSVIK